MSGDASIYQDIESLAPDQLGTYFSTLSFAEIEKQTLMKIRNSIILEIENSCPEVHHDTRRKIIKVIKNKFN